MGNKNSYNKFIQKNNIDINNSFIIYNFLNIINDEYDSQIKKKYKKLLLIIEIDNIYFFSKNNKLKFKLNFNDIDSWSSQNISSTFLIRYNSNNLLFFESNELNIISKKLLKNANILCRLNDNNLINYNINNSTEETNNINQSYEYSEENIENNLFELPN